MARPTTKKELLSQSQQSFEKLKTLIEGMSEEELTTPFDFADQTNRKEAHWQRDKNLRDVLIHLYEWQYLLIDWVEKNQKGQAHPFLPAPYTWKSYGQMNEEFLEKHQTTSLAEAKNMIEESHKKVTLIIKEFSNEELFTKKHFDWTGTTSLGSYCISATSSHYEWAIKKIRAHIRNCKKYKKRVNL